MFTPCIDPRHAPRLAPYLPTEHQAWTRATVKRFGGFGSHVPAPPPAPPVSRADTHVLSQRRHSSAPSRRPLHERVARALKEMPSRRELTREERETATIEAKVLARRTVGEDGHVRTSSGPGVRAQVWRNRSKGRGLAASADASAAYFEREGIGPPRADDARSGFAGSGVHGHSTSTSAEATTAAHRRAPPAPLQDAHGAPRSARTTRWGVADPLGSALLSSWEEWTPRQRASERSTAPLEDDDWWPSPSRAQRRHTDEARKAEVEEEAEEARERRQGGGGAQQLIQRVMRQQPRDAGGKVVPKPAVLSRYATALTTSHAASRAVVAAVLGLPPPAWPLAPRRTPRGKSSEGHAAAAPNHPPPARAPSEQRAAPPPPPPPPQSAREPSRKAPLIHQQYQSGPPLSARAMVRPPSAPQRATPVRAGPYTKSTMSTTAASRPAPQRPASAQARVRAGGS